MPNLLGSRKQASTHDRGNGCAGSDQGSIQLSQGNLLTCAFESWCHWKQGVNGHIKKQQCCCTRHLTNTSDAQMWPGKFIVLHYVSAMLWDCWYVLWSSEKKETNEGWRSQVNWHLYECCCWEGLSQRACIAAIAIIIVADRYPGSSKNSAGTYLIFQHLAIFSMTVFLCLILLV